MLMRIMEDRNGNILMLQFDMQFLFLNGSDFKNIFCLQPLK